MNNLYYYYSLKIANRKPEERNGGNTRIGNRKQEEK